MPPDPASSSRRERAVAERKPPRRLLSTPSPGMSRLWLQPLQHPQPALMPSPSSNIHGATGAGGRRTVPFPACDTGGSREKKQLKRRRTATGSHGEDGRTRHRGDGGRVLHRRVGKGHPRDAELGGDGIAKGRETGRMLLLQHLSAAASLRRCASEATTGQGAAASTGPAATRPSNQGCFGGGGWRVPWGRGEGWSQAL